MYIVYHTIRKHYLGSISTIMGMPCYNWVAEKEDAKKMSKEEATKVSRMWENSIIIKVD